MQSLQARRPVRCLRALDRCLKEFGRRLQKILTLFSCLDLILLMGSLLIPNAHNGVVLPDLANPQFANLVGATRGKDLAHRASGP